MSDETRAVPTSADIEAIRQRAETIIARCQGYLNEPTSDPFPAGVRVLKQEIAAQQEWLDVIAALDGERRHRADLERQLEEAQAIFCEQIAEHERRIMGGLHSTLNRLPVAKWLARQVVQEAEG